MACGCPDAVTQTLRRKVRTETAKLASILRSTDMFNDAFGATAGVAVADVDSAVSAIPSPSPLNFLDLLQYATCPLTPLALGLSLGDLASLDPEAQLKKVKGLGSGDIANARRSYESTLNNSPNAALVKQARRYEQSLRRLQFDEASFAEALVISATVLVVCGQEEFLAGGYAEFAQYANGFSFTGGVPATLDQNLAVLIQRLQRGEQKFKALREALV